MDQPMHSKLQRRTLLKTAPAAGLATLMRPEGSLGADAVRFAFFADPSEAIAYAQLIDRFEEVQSEIKIEPVVISSSNVAPLGRLLPASKYPEWLRGSFTGPNPPDVFLFTYRDVGAYDLRGVLEPLDTWLAQSRTLNEADFNPEALSLFRPMNKPLLAIPQNLSSLVVYYNTDLFEPPTIKRMLGAFERLLEGIVDDPQQSVGGLPLLSESEAFHLIHEFNDTRRQYPLDLAIHHLFSERAALAPDAVALVFDGRALTYGELDRRANQLARHLLALGLPPESFVGVFIPRSPEMIVALLGVLKAGGAYAPLDPSLPAERLFQIVDDASPYVILTLDEMSDRLAPTGLPGIRLDADWPLIASESADAPPSQEPPDQLAYVCYTSGSSGRPKGVAVTHRGVLRLVCGVDYVDLNSSETILQAAPLAFDAATFEIWGALLNGGRLALYPDQTPTPGGLREALRSEQVTTAWLTAALFNYVVDEDVEALSEVRQLLVGGEALSARHVEEARRRAPRTKLINGYGPTEATTFSCCGEVGEGPIRLGRPIANTQVYVVDGRGEAVACGARGELWIGGDGLARCYHGDASRTAEKFAPDGLSGRYGGRVYRSGDLTRQEWNGEVEYLGRLDNQVKLRGYRVELEEVEAELRRVGGVKAAAARVEEDERGEKRLVGYVVWEEGRKRGWNEARAEMRERAPEYMLPSAWVELAELPLNNNGKVDRRKLGGVFIERAVIETEYEGPRTPEEERMAGIWKKILGVDRVGVHDNFFALGGHSLLATQLVSQIGREFQVNLPIRSLFEAPTVAELTRQIADLNGSQEELIRKATQALQFVKSLTESETQALLREKQIPR